MCVTVAAAAAQNNVGMTVRDQKFRLIRLLLLWMASHTGHETHTTRHLQQQQQPHRPRAVQGLLAQDILQHTVLETMSNPSNSPENDTNPQSQPQQDNWQLPPIPAALTHPANVLLLTSVPLLAGAFVGYKLPNMKTLEDMVEVGKNATTKTRPTSSASANAALQELNPDEARALASRMAVQAFRIATFGTVATFGVVGAAAFYLSGYHTVDEAVQGTRVWATSLRESLETFFGTAERREQQLAQHPDMVATKHMTEEQEMNYLYRKYLASSADEDETNDATNASNSSDVNQQTKT